MLEGIEVRLNTDYLENREALDALAGRVVYTGPLDAFFGYSLGRLEYRSVRFETERLDIPNFQGNAVVNYTDRETPWTRIIEHKWLHPGCRVPGARLRTGAGHLRRPPGRIQVLRYGCGDRRGAPPQRGGPMILRLLKKYKDLILYAVFGLLTTLVNTAVYWLSAHPLGMPTVPSSIVAWFMAVLFAYLTNRRWVFHSEAETPAEIGREIVSFFLCRLATGVLDWGLMWLLVDKLHLNDLVMKLLVNALVILLNYVASKLLIFRRKKKETPENKEETEG